MMMSWHGIEERIHDDGVFTCPIDGMVEIWGEEWSVCSK